jgi:arginine decarboxylase
MDATPATATPRVDDFLASAEARFDRWRDLLSAAQAWAASHGGADARRVLATAFDTVRPYEEFFGYPGPRLLAILADRLASGDATGFARLTRRISAAMMSRSYRHEANDWDVQGETPTSVAERAGSDGETRRPYFEALVVSSLPPQQWASACAEFNKLRRPLDPFIYETVMTGSFEDAVLGVILNGGLQAVIIYDHIPCRSRHDVKLMDAFLKTYMPEGGSDVPGAHGVPLARVLKSIRPELDLYLLSDRKVEEIAGDPEISKLFRRVFYAVEEPMELHLAMLEGVGRRYETPFFDNLKKYAARAISTFHALPIARGKSIMKSNWISDMGEFYGLNLFLAESSATTGGLDSLLEPTGTIKRAQELAAEAFGADHCFFVTNGTSTSNKMVHQALLAPGDIAMVDRNCHKSHHYGMVLAGAQPYYVEAYPMTQYSMYGAVPLRTIKQAMLALKAEGKLDKLKLLVLTNCTFDGHVYHCKRVMEECLAIKPDLIFLWDEAWFGFARFSALYRARTAMGAATYLETLRDSPAAQAAWDAQVTELGANFDPADARLLERRLVPNPAALKIRVYETNSTHKSMSALRQGSWVMVRDQDFHRHESAFREAVFTHASTSPNQQIIASLDVARRQMALEGFELVQKAIAVALDIRRAVNGHKLISKYFTILGAADMVPAEYRQTGFQDFIAPGATWLDVVESFRNDEFVLDPTRLTLVCGTAGFDGTAFKGMLANRYDIQLNKTSRNSVLLQSNINNTRSDVAHLIKVLAEISHEIDQRLSKGSEAERQAFAARVQSLMHDVPDLPNFSRFHDGYRDDPAGHTVEGHMREAFYAAYNEDDCEYVPINGTAIDQRLKDGPEIVSANFVIPYPPGFPIMVPGQVITQETIDFMRKLDVKEIHGYVAALGLKAIRPDRIKART